MNIQPTILLLAIALTTTAAAALSAKTDFTTPVRGSAYSAFVEGVDGTAPYTYAITAGSLPAGLSLNTGTGEVTGTPTTQGYYEFTTTVTDALTNTYDIVNSLTVKGGLAFSTPSLPYGGYGLAYSTQLEASGGTPPYTFSLTGGGVPASGFTLSSGGVVAGTGPAPNLPQAWTKTYKVTDSVGNYAEKVYTLYLFPSLYFRGGRTIDSYVGVYTEYPTSIGHWVADSPAIPPPVITYAVTAGAIPDGMVLNPATGLIYGIPTTAGTYSWTLTATDTLGFTLAVAPTVIIGTTDDIPRRFRTSVGDGSTTVFTVTHDLNTYEIVSLTLIDTTLTTPQPVLSPGVDYTWKIIDNTSIEITFSVAPATDTIYVLITG